MSQSNSNSNPSGNPMSKINRALGLFLLCFGLIILVAVLFTETTAGKLTNLVSAIILLAIGVAMVYKARD